MFDVIINELVTNDNMKYTEAISSEIFSVISKASKEINIESYVIGGFVRDYFLKRGTAKDIDVVAIGSGIELAEKVAKLLPNKPKVQVFKTYGTAMLRYKDVEIEFVGARKNRILKIVEIQKFLWVLCKMIKIEEILP